MSKRSEDAAQKAYPIHPCRLYPIEGAHGEILNFDEWLDDFRIGIQSFSANAGFEQGYEQAEKDALERAIEWWRPKLCGFLKEGLTEGVLGEFRKAMEEEL